MTKEELINYYKNYLDLINKEIDIDEYNGKYPAINYAKRSCYKEFIEHLRDLE